MNAPECQRLCLPDQPLCGDCWKDYEEAYAQDARQGLDGQADGEPLPQVAVPESAHAAKRAACEEQRQSTRDALSASANEAGAEGPSENEPPERVVLDVATLRYVIYCLELQARQCSTSKRSPVAAKLRSMAARRQAARYFWEQAEYWRRQGDNAYADYCDNRAGEWAAQS